MATSGRPATEDFYCRSWRKPERSAISCGERGAKAPGRTARVIVGGLIAFYTLLLSTAVSSAPLMGHP